MVLFLVAVIIILLVYIVLDKYLLNKPAKEEKFIQEEKPFVATGSILTEIERSFYHTLKQYSGDKYVICPKIDSADFLLCDPRNAWPVCGIVLNDPMNSTFERDQAIDKAYGDAGIPLIRFASKPSYNVAEINDAMEFTFSNRPVNTPKEVMKETPKEAVKETSYTAPIEVVEEAAPVDDIVLCPKCNLPMVLRKGGRGRRAYYGCVNPECKEVVEK